MRKKCSKAGNARETACATTANQHLAKLVGQAFSLPGLLPRPDRVLALLGVALALAAGSLGLVQAQTGSDCPMKNPPPVLTSQYNAFRNSVNDNETCLTPAQSTFFNSGTGAPVFVLKASFPTPYSGGGQAPVYAQPLYFPGLTISGASHNVLFAAALNDGVYAYDADNYGTGSPGAGVLYWSRLLTSDCNRTVDSTLYPGALLDFYGLSPLPYAGIVSTPVIDKTSQTMYLVGGCQETDPDSSAHHWYLHALNISTGADAVPAVEITGGVTPTGALSTAFVPGTQVQRLSLAEFPDSNLVYIGFGTGVNEGPNQLSYHGWLFGYRNTGTALVQQSVFVTTPYSSTYTAPGTTCTSGTPVGSYLQSPNWCGESGGIWMSGRAPAFNVLNGEPYLFVASGNGGFQTAVPQNWGESLMKFTYGSATAPTDFFTASSPSVDQGYIDENENDVDLGTSGVVLFNGLVNGTEEPFVVVTDKAGNLYLTSQETLGGFNTPDQVAQEFIASGTSPCPQQDPPTTYCREIHSLVYWDTNLYMWAMGDVLRAYTFSNGTFLTPSRTATGIDGFPGAGLVLSSSGTTNGILWAVHSSSTPTTRMNATLSAINTSTLATIWSSTDLWMASTFALPTVVNGRVYVGTFNDGVIVYSNR
jgi:hypothetical protein